MRASEWQYLCAVHEPPKPCCAIDYSCHTLDWAAGILTSQKHFPSRLTLGNESQGGQQAGVRQLTNIMRRVYRIFAHAWFQHRGVFWDVEGREGLYVLFKTVCDFYGLIPEENYTIPLEAEGLDEAGEEKARARSPEKKGGKEEEAVGGGSGPGATQRRHKATPSVGSAVGTIAEGDEDDKGDGSPVKEGKGVSVDTMAKAPVQENAGASTAAGPKVAEKMDVSPGKEKREAPVISVDGAPPSPPKKAPGSPKKEQVKEQESSQRTDSGLGRSNSSDSVASQVKVEEKEVEEVPSS